MAIRAPDGANKCSKRHMKYWVYTVQLLDLQTFKLTLPLFRTAGVYDKSMITKRHFIQEYFAL